MKTKILRLDATHNSVELLHTVCITLLTIFSKKTLAVSLEEVSINKILISFIDQQLQMKVMFMQGLKNILKGSLSNQILGDIGGFSYQGQNIYVKAVKFDQLESRYSVNASLPKSLDGKLS